MTKAEAKPPRKLLLEIDEDIYQALCQALWCRGVTGNLCGELDEFTMLVAKAMEEGRGSLHIIKKAPKPKRRKAKKK